jgi:hypothetical protein
MKGFKKILKMSALVFLMVLASVGIGIVGPVPVSINKRRENDDYIRIEKFEIREEDVQNEHMGAEQE